MKLFKYCLKAYPLVQHLRRFRPATKPQHLICFKQWTREMVMDILVSAINLKRLICDTHNKRIDILKDSKVMVLQEVNEPILNMAVSKASTFLGAYDVNITDNLVWEKDYNGKVFSLMADVIFVATTTHMCVQRFAEQSLVPVLCMRSRTHASIQALATVMAIIEEFGTMTNVTVSYVGNPHPVLNSYLLLCPMLGANIRYQCCCNKETGVCPLLHKASEDMTHKSHTECKECMNIEQVLHNTCVVIAGPTSATKTNAKGFTLSETTIKKYTPCQWIFFHTCPRGDEVDNELFNHCNARTFSSYYNMQYITAALMANSVKGYRF